MPRREDRETHQDACTYQQRADQEQAVDGRRIQRQYSRKLKRQGADQTCSLRHWSPNLRDWRAVKKVLNESPERIWACLVGFEKVLLHKKQIFTAFLYWAICVYCSLPFMHGQAMNPATEAGNRLSNTPSQCDDKRINLYVVSVSKFLLLYGFTAGGYMVYWSYRNQGPTKQ